MTYENLTIITQIKQNI